MACAGRMADDEDGARMRQKHVEASENVQAASQAAAAPLRASVAKAHPSKVLKKNGAVHACVIGDAPAAAAELDTSQVLPVSLT